VATRKKPDNEANAKPLAPERDPYGKGYHRPTRTEAEDDPAKFYDLVAYLRAKRNLTWQAIGDELGIDASNASRRVNGKALDAEERKLILDYLFVESKVISDPAGAEISAIRDNLYFSLVDFYNIKATSQDNVRAKSSGTYQLWRHSVEESGAYVHGRVDFAEDEMTGAMRVTMIQPRKARDGMRALTEEFTGYLFKVADMYVMQLRDIANDDLRITIFPHFRVENIGTDKNPDSVFPGTVSHIVHMDGFGMGIDGHNLFVSPVYLELVDDRAELDQLNAKLDVVSESEAPKRIVSKLARARIVVT
jgi:hypothetical protein